MWKKKKVENKKVIRINFENHSKYDIKFDSKEDSKEFYNELCKTLKTKKR